MPADPTHPPRTTLARALLYSCGTGFFATALVLFLLLLWSAFSPMGRTAVQQSLTTGSIWEVVAIAYFLGFSTMLEAMLMLWWKER